MSDTLPRYVLREASHGQRGRWPYRRVAVLELLDGRDAPYIRDLPGRVRVVRTWDDLPARGAKRGALAAARAEAAALVARLLEEHADRVRAEAEEARQEADAAAAAAAVELALVEAEQAQRGAA
jgi:hypothetical protein